MFFFRKIKSYSIEVLLIFKEGKYFFLFIQKKYFPQVLSYGILTLPKKTTGVPKHVMIGWPNRSKTLKFLISRPRIFFPKINFPHVVCKPRGVERNNWFAKLDKKKTPKISYLIK